MGRQTDRQTWRG